MNACYIRNFSNFHRTNMLPTLYYTNTHAISGREWIQIETKDPEFYLEMKKLRFKGHINIVNVFYKKF